MRPEIKRILFAQNATVIDQQRQIVTDRLRQSLDAHVEFAAQPEDVTPGSTFDAVIAPTIGWLPELLTRIDGAPWIHFLSSGVEKIWEMDVDWARYTLTSSKGVHAIPISEYVLGAMLHFAKRFDQFTSQAREGVWERAWLPELTDAHVVMVGAGNIGREVSRRCRFLGMRTQAVARTARTDEDLGEVLGFAQLSQAAATADYLVVAVPLTADTAGLVDQDVLGSTKQGAVLIDVSRGGVVSEDAVVSALDSGLLRGAALDVFEEEPLSAKSPLWGRPNVLITPHVAGTTPRYIERALEVFVGNAMLRRAGLSITTEVEVSRGY